MSDDETREKLLLLTAALFAVRLFRDAAPTPLRAFSPDDQPRLAQEEQLDREEAARRAAADAEAIMVAVYAVKL